ncbi:penicillin-binding protein 2, partial [Burkholderia pseudomallei]
AKLLDMPLAEVRRRLTGDRSFVLHKRQVDPDTAARIEKLDIDGVTQIADSKRFDPAGESAAHVVGFTNVEDRGQEG